ncbi:hypothetical protein FRB90_002980 [Tulasnella sp. 427]|nr:hypothetical protein FRB90_002980 [Tulasnella sp. 427]
MNNQTSGQLVSHNQLQQVGSGEALAHRLNEEINALKINIHSVVQSTKWPSDSKDAADVLLKFVQPATTVPKDVKKVSQELQTAIEKYISILEDVRTRVKDASSRPGKRRWRSLNKINPFSSNHVNRCTLLFQGCQQDVVKAANSVNECLKRSLQDKDDDQNRDRSTPSCPPNILSNNDYHGISSTAAILTEAAVPGEASTHRPLRQDVLTAARKTFKGLEIASSSIPVAGNFVGAAAKVGLAFVESIQTMDRNDDLAKDLGAQTARLSSLLQHFNGGFKAGQHDVIANHVNELHRELQDMQTEVNAWKSKGRFAKAFSSRDGAETLKGHQSTIQTALEEMQFLVSLNINDMMIELRNTELQEEAGRLLDRLGDGKYGSRGDTLEEIVCFPGTRASILSSIDDWLKDQSEDSRVLWIGGMAGRGKSTIASTVVHNWKARGSCAIFHFRRGQTVLNSRVVCSLARQLGNSLNPVIRRAVVESVRQNRDIADKRLEEQFETLLVGSLSTLDDHSHPIILVIDALDESDNGKEATKLIQFIDEHSSSLSPNVKFLLTCRIEGFIPHKLESRGWHKEDLDVSVDISNDIETLVKEKCKEIRNEHRLPESWPHSNEIALLVQMSEGLFQWARTVINYIRDGSPQDRLRMLLKYPERWSGLDDLYHQILEKAFHNVELDLERQHLLHSLLGTLVVAPVPVHLGSLAGLFENEGFFEGIKPDASSGLTTLTLINYTVN